MLVWFVLAVVKRDNGIVDIAWGGGFVGIYAILTISLAQPLTLRQCLLGVLLLVWAVRLSAYIYWRNRARLGEDFRYAAWREQWGQQWLWRTFWQVFMLQGFFMFLLALPIILVMSDNKLTNLHYIDLIGTVVFIVGFVFEAVGDWQLYRFKADAAHKGKIMKLGLWKYTRHPNYFGEMVLWWGIFIVALSVQNGIFGIVSPIVLTWLLTRVSGVPMLERKYRDNPDYAAYIQQTPAFIPKWW